MSEESKKKISDRMKEVRKEIPNPMSGRTGELHHNFGKHWDEETRKKMSDAKKGKPSTFKGKRHTEEANQDHLMSKGDIIILIFILRIIIFGGK